jgi:hypothetical protein
LLFRDKFLVHRKVTAAPACGGANASANWLQAAVLALLRPAPRCATSLAAIAPLLTSILGVMTAIPLHDRPA